MFAEDGKMRLTDVAYTEQLFRIIQSIPSPKAEPFKQWLTKVGYPKHKVFYYAMLISAQKRNEHKYFVHLHTKSRKNFQLNIKCKRISNEH